MALPALTPDQRADALAKADAARKARAEVKAKLKTGRMSIADVLDQADTDPIIGKTKVLAILTAMPKIGPVHAADIMADLEISPMRRVKGLGDRQRHELLARFGFTD